MRRYIKHFQNDYNTTEMCHQNHLFSNLQPIPFPAYYDIMLLMYYIYAGVYYFGERNVTFNIHLSALFILLMQSFFENIFRAGHEMPLIPGAALRDKHAAVVAAKLQAEPRA